MRISVIGLGYVGAVTAGCLARHGHSIVGVDVRPQHVEDFNAGFWPGMEPGLSDLLKAAKEKGLLSATLSCQEAVLSTDITLICVGTPATVAGSQDLSHVRQVLKEIAAALRKKSDKHAVVLRSAVLPGSTARLTSDLLIEQEASGFLKVFYYPEFMREGTAVEDFENPSLTVVGTRDGTRPPAELMSAIFGEKAVVLNWPTAELLKSACNAFHATKVAFANEIGRLGKRFQIDARMVMELLCQDTRLNMSPCYLRPGNPFGGACLPKDVRVLMHHGRQQGLYLPLIESLLLSNDQHRQTLLGAITESGHNEVVILGLSFKADTGDLRESAMVGVAQTLFGLGYTLRIYDPSLNLDAVSAGNKRVIDTQMPHLASVFCSDLAAAIGQQGLIVAAQKCAGIPELSRLVTQKHAILDLNGWPELKGLAAKYEGLCW